MPERAVDLLSQVADVDIDDVRPALEREVPGAVEQLGAAERHAGPAHEQLEQRELLGGEVELLVAAPRPVRSRIQTEIADLEDGRPLHRRASSQRAQPREQLLEGERLGEVIVGAGIESIDAVVDGVARREHQDGRPDAAAAHQAADLEAVRPGSITSRTIAS